MTRNRCLMLLSVALLLTSGCLAHPHSSLRPRNHRVSMKRAAREWSAGPWMTGHSDREMRRQARLMERQMAHAPNPNLIPYQPVAFPGGPDQMNPYSNGMGWGQPWATPYTTYMPGAEMAMMEMGMMGFAGESGDCGCGAAVPEYSAPMMGDSGCGCGGGTVSMPGEVMSGELIQQSAPNVLNNSGDQPAGAGAQAPVNDADVVPMPMGL